MATQQKIMLRRQQLTALRHTLPRFSITEAAGELGVSRWTVKSDLEFLAAHNLLGLKRSLVFPFEPVESGAEFMQRFQAAHVKKKEVIEGLNSEKQNSRGINYENNPSINPKNREPQT